MKSDQELISSIQESPQDAIAFSLGRDEYVVMPREKFEKLLAAAEAWAGAVERSRQLSIVGPRGLLHSGRRL